MKTKVDIILPYLQGGKPTVALISHLSNKDASQMFIRDVKLDTVLH